ncbi:MAG: M28 family peptidase, partial [Xanthomonadales bacterium]|nr:M28 family peptidase [Xanthomonadales bacterium]
MRNPLITLALFVMCNSVFAQDVIFHHDLAVTIDPASSQLEAKDTITLPDPADLAGLSFSLHGNLSVKSLTDGVTLQETVAEGAAEDKGMDQEDYTSVIQSKRYRVRVDDGITPEALSLAFNGVINHPVKQANQEYARGFSQSPGLIDPQGVYLAGSTNWIPSFGDEYVTYTMKVQSPPGWRSVSQGKRTGFEESPDFRTDVWEVDTPTEEIFVIAAQFTEYEYPMGNVAAMAFLREKDDGLANKYLETTAQYMEMYRELIGPYPYSKFALVENFWETGYGMPSFTLLGPQIIRFPFILHSSYPHELLHNWWGNGVFVDFETGNWCEGLTAYMADQLIAEQRGTGAEYRRTTLQGYTDYVTDENEFPLKDFRSRHNASSSSIGYGKTAMMWDMLREQVGDENFSRAFQKFYRDNTFKRAGFDDIRVSFEDVTGEQLGGFFRQWVERPGAPILNISEVKLTEGDGHKMLEIELQQIQQGDAFDLMVPVVVYSADKVERELVSMTSKTQRFTFPLDCDPLRVEVDPQFNVMRRLDYREVPPSLSKMFGAEKILMLLPSKASAEDLANYRQLSSIWKGERGDEFSIKLDSEIEALPADSGVWVLGWNNLWFGAVQQALEDYDAEISPAMVRFGTTSHDPAQNSFVVALRHPGNTDLAMTFLTAHDAEAVAGLARKLPHYGKYSYLGFTGDEPTNSAKGQWPSVGSPLAADLAEYSEPLPQLEKRPALAMLAPVFNAERMKADVEKLAGEAMQGRGPGSAGHEAAAEYIAEQFKAAGLEPAGDDGSYFQPLTITGEDGKEITVRNVLGVIPGGNADWQDQSVVLSAHYDHLGLGWPDAKAGNKGKIHHGADDNASGVAVMLELARTLGKSMEPSRSVVFA